MSQTYYAILTEAGEAKLANAAALNQPLQVSKMAVGDGNGVLPNPVRTQPALVKENYRADLNSLIVDPANASQIIAELVIPEGTGGWWIREMALYDAAGVMIAVANCPPSYKPIVSEGSGRTQVLRMVLIVSSTAAVQLKIDPSVVLATRAYVQTTVDALRADLVNAIGQAAAATAADLLPQINAKLPLVGGNVSGFVNFNRSITGGYGTTTGTGNAWAAPIWAMGPGYSGGAAGTTFSPAGMYGVAWYRTGAYGEGAYLYVNGTAVGAMGQTGIFTVGGFYGKGTGLTEVPPAAISPVSIFGTAESYSVTLPGGLILKFGTFTRATAFSEGELITITFTDAFPSTCLWGGAMQVNTSGAANVESMYLRKSMTKTNAVIMVEHVQAAGMNGKEFAWFFVGK